VVVLASCGGAGVRGRNGGGRRPRWRERGKKRLAEERKTFTAAYYRRSSGWPVVLATLGGVGCSMRSCRKKW
jgi:hypothetical protein